LFNVAGFGGTIVNLDAIPAVRRLRGPRRNNFFDRVEMVIAGEAKRSSGGRLFAEDH